MVISLTIINTQSKEFSQHSCFSLNKFHKKSFYNTVVSLLKNDNGTVNFQKGIINDGANIRRIKTFFD